MVSYVLALPRRGVLNVLVLFAILAAALGSTTPAAAATYPLVSIGQSGANVTTLQYLLRQRGYNLQGTGTFGPLTETSVKAFQRTVPMQPNGVVGPVTWSNLVVPLAAGARGHAVTALQVQLTKHGYPLQGTGTFGPTTEASVKAFQRTVGMSPNGVVGPRTWQALLGTSTASAASSTYATPNGYVYTGRRAEVLQHLQQRFSTRVTTYGSHSECPTCSADLWTPDARGGVDNTSLPRMNEVAEYVRANRASLGIAYVIWNQHITSGSGWQAMDDRGSLTANHKDHVHITFLDSFR